MIANAEPCSKTKSAIDKALKDFKTSSELLRIVSTAVTAALGAVREEFDARVKALEEKLARKEEEISELTAKLESCQAAPTRPLLSSFFNGGGNEKVSDEAVDIISACKKELKDSQRREKNVMIFGLPCSQSSQQEAREAEDLDQVKRVLEEIDPSVSPMSIYRFRSRPNSMRPPPVLVTLDSAAVRNSILKNSKRLRERSATQNVFVGPDLTPIERELAKKMRRQRDELGGTRREEAGAVGHRGPLSSRPARH